MQLRSGAASLPKHLVPVERKKFSVLLRPPRKCVDAIKTQNVIDAKKMEAASNTADALSPPIEVAVTHYVPVKNWDAPVLSPLLRELVVLAMGLGRPPPPPIARKFPPSPQHI